MGRPFLMTRKTAISHLDMDELTFERFIVPAVTRIKFGAEVYFISDEIEVAVMDLVDDSAADVQ